MSRGGSILVSAEVVNKKIKGFISLTAILAPRINQSGVGQYFLSRLSVNLQSEKKEGGYSAILNSCKTNASCEDDGPKWHPVRVHRVHIPNGKDCQDGKLRLRARVYLRDKFSIDTQIGNNRIGTLSKVSFALTFVCIDKDKMKDTYNGFVQKMKSNIASAVVEQEFEVLT